LVHNSTVFIALQNQNPRQIRHFSCPSTTQVAFLSFLPAIYTAGQLVYAPFRSPSLS
jgi:hypothetical protein